MNDEDMHSLKRELLDKHKGFKCPNCDNGLDLSEVDYKFQGNLYDKWTCEYCSHILVLDWRSSK